MASVFSKYAAFVFSLAEYQQGVGYSTVSEDFPVVLGPATLYDTVTGIQRFVGRDEATGLPLIVTGYDRYITEITTHGVQGASDGISPPFGIEPDVCSVTVEVTAATVLAAIEGMAKHVVYGVWNCQPDADPDDLPAPLLPYYVDTPMLQAKKDYIQNALINRGAPADMVNTWFTNHPNATPQQLQGAFAQLVAMVTRAAG